MDTDKIYMEQLRQTNTRAEVHDQVVTPEAGQQGPRNSSHSFTYTFGIISALLVAGGNVPFMKCHRRRLTVTFVLNVIVGIHPGC